MVKAAQTLRKRATCEVYMGGPWQAGSPAETSSKRLKETEKAAAPVAK